jgi:hypothetical protein
MLPGQTDYHTVITWLINRRGMLSLVTLTLSTRQEKGLQRFISVNVLYLQCMLITYRTISGTPLTATRMNKITY